MDEHPKQTSMEKMAKLPPVFKKNGTVNAGNASVSLNNHDNLVCWSCYNC